MNTSFSSTSSMQPPLNDEMKAHMQLLRNIVSNPEVVKAYNEAIAAVTPVLYDGNNTPNPWINKTIDYFVEYFQNWFTYLPEPLRGLGKIQWFTYFYLENPKAYYFLNNFESRQNPNLPLTKEIFNWSVEFIKIRGRFMDSPESLLYVNEWVNDPETKIEDFIVPKGGFKSFNEFFTRELKSSAKARPVNAPLDDSILVASADTEVNFIQSDLTLTTPIKVKTRHINVNQLLDNSEYAKNFVGGTAISCVLMPNSYHRYHSPVNGIIVESQEVPGIYNGIMDGEDWFNKGNIGEGTTDFSIFEDFHRSYYIFQTWKHGYVALIPVGLNTISAMFPTMVNDKSVMVPPGGEPVAVNKGDELGYFAYGGSLNILLFQKGILSSLNVLMGQRLGQMNKLKPE